MSDKNTFYAGLNASLEQLRNDGLYKQERGIASRQGAEGVFDAGGHRINLFANI